MISPAGAGREGGEGEGVGGEEGREGGIAGRDGVTGGEVLGEGVVRGKVVVGVTVGVAAGGGAGRNENAPQESDSLAPAASIFVLHEEEIKTKYPSSSFRDPRSSVHRECPAGLCSEKNPQPGVKNEGDLYYYRFSDTYTTVKRDCSCSSESSSSRTSCRNENSTTVKCCGGSCSSESICKRSTTCSSGSTCSIPGTGRDEERENSKKGNSCSDSCSCCLKSEQSRYSFWSAPAAATCSRSTLLLDKEEEMQKKEVKEEGEKGKEVKKETGEEDKDQKAKEEAKNCPGTGRQEEAGTSGGNTSRSRGAEVRRTSIAIRESRGEEVRENRSEDEKTDKEEGGGRRWRLTTSLSSLAQGGGSMFAGELSPKGSQTHSTKGEKEQTTGSQGWKAEESSVFCSSLCEGTWHALLPHYRLLTEPPLGLSAGGIAGLRAAAAAALEPAETLPAMPRRGLHSFPFTEKEKKEEVQEEKQISEKNISPEREEKPFPLAQQRGEEEKKERGEERKCLGGLDKEKEGEAGGVAVPVKGRASRKGGNLLKEIAQHSAGGAAAAVATVATSASKGQMAAGLSQTAFRRERGEGEEAAAAAGGCAGKGGGGAAAAARRGGRVTVKSAGSGEEEGEARLLSEVKKSSTGCKAVGASSSLFGEGWLGFSSSSSGRGRGGSCAARRSSSRERKSGSSGSRGSSSSGGSRGSSNSSGSKDRSSTSSGSKGRSSNSSRRSKGRSSSGSRSSNNASSLQLKSSSSVSSFCSSPLPTTSPFSSPSSSLASLTAASSPIQRRSEERRSRTRTPLDAALPLRASSSSSPSSSPSSSFFFSSSSPPPSPASASSSSSSPSSSSSGEEEAAAAAEHSDSSCRVPCASPPPRAGEEGDAPQQQRRGEDGRKTSLRVEKENLKERKEGEEKRPRAGLSGGFVEKMSASWKTKKPRGNQAAAGGEEEGGGGGGEREGRKQIARKDAVSFAKKTCKGREKSSQLPTKETEEAVLALGEEAAALPAARGNRRSRAPSPKCLRFGSAAETLALSSISPPSSPSMTADESALVRGEASLMLPDQQQRLLLSPASQTPAAAATAPALTAAAPTAGPGSTLPYFSSSSSDPSPFSPPFTLSSPGTPPDASAAVQLLGGAGAAAAARGAGQTAAAAAQEETLFDSAAERGRSLSERAAAAQKSSSDCMTATEGKGKEKEEAGGRGGAARLREEQQRRQGRNKPRRTTGGTAEGRGSAEGEMRRRRGDEKDGFLIWRNGSSSNSRSSRRGGGSSRIEKMLVSGENSRRARNLDRDSEAQTPAKDKPEKKQQERKEEEERQKQQRGGERGKEGRSLSVPRIAEEFFRQMSVSPSSFSRSSFPSSTSSLASSADEQVPEGVTSLKDALDSFMSSSSSSPSSPSYSSLTSSNSLGSTTEGGGGEAAAPIWQRSQSSLAAGAVREGGVRRSIRRRKNRGDEEEDELLPSGWARQGAVQREDVQAPGRGGVTLSPLLSGVRTTEMRRRVEHASRDWSGRREEGMGRGGTGGRGDGSEGRERREAVEQGRAGGRRRGRGGRGRDEEEDEGEEAKKAEGVKRNVSIQDFPIEVLQAALQFLLVEEILRLQTVCTDFYAAVKEQGETFAYVRRLKMDVGWGLMDVTERQEILLQMQRLRHLHVSANVFSTGSVTIQEVAALIFRNADTLRYLCLHSPENQLHDETPVHAPFALMPRPFCRLRSLLIVGCQTLEWAHIFSNCSFPSVERFDVTHFPVRSDHWSWQVLPDFTTLGVRGLHRILDCMPVLERFTIGLEVRYEEDRRGQVWNFDFLQREGNFFHDWRRAPNNNLGNGRRRQQDDSGVRPSQRFAVARGNSFARGGAREREHSGIFSQVPTGIAGESEPVGAELGRLWTNANDEEEEREQLAEVEPVGGTALLRSWRGKISEEDFADLFAVAYIRAGAAGNLKRIIIKHRVQAENKQVPSINVNTVTEFFQGAAAFCYRYVSDVFTALPGIRS